MALSISVVRLVWLMCCLVQVPWLALRTCSCYQLDSGNSTSNYNNNDNNSHNIDDDTLIERHQLSPETGSLYSRSGSIDPNDRNDSSDIIANQSRARQQMHPPLAPVEVPVQMPMPLPGAMMRQQVPPPIMLQPQIIAANAIPPVVQAPPPPPPPPPQPAQPASLAASLPQLFMAASQPPPPGADEVCGLNMKDFRHERIVGGRSASYGEVPFIVHLRESHLFRVLGYNKCGGVLINHRWALTAAHCKPAFFSSLEIILGKHKTFEDAPPPEGSAMAAIVKMAGKSLNADDTVELVDSRSGPNSTSTSSSISPIKIKKQPVLQVLADTVIVHPNFESKTLENDLALIKLKKPVPFREDIQPICLPHVNEDFTGLDAFATGWGLTDFDKRQLPDTLQIVRLPIMSNKRCQAMYAKAGHDKQITDLDLCAGYAKGGMDACEGDSGGPLFVRRPDDYRWVLAGIVSNGVKCGEPMLPGVYTRVSRFVPWILEQMRLHS